MRSISLDAPEPDCPPVAGPPELEPPEFDPPDCAPEDAELRLSLSCSMPRVADCSRRVPARSAKVRASLVNRCAGSERRTDCHADWIC